MAVLRYSQDKYNAFILLYCSSQRYFTFLTFIIHNDFVVVVTESVHKIFKISLTSLLYIKCPNAVIIEVEGKVCTQLQQMINISGRNAAPNSLGNTLRKNTHAMKIENSHTRRAIKKTVFF